MYRVCHTTCRLYLLDPSSSSSQTTSGDATPAQHVETTHPDNVNLKLAFHKVASFHPHCLTFNSDLPPPSAQVEVMAYADDISIASEHTSTSAARKYIQPYLHKVFSWTKQNNLINTKSRQTTCTLFTPDSAYYTSNLDLKNTTMHYP